MNDPFADLQEDWTPYTGKADFKDVNPQFMDNFTQMAREYYDQTGNQLKVTDAFRSRATQAKAYADWKAGIKKVPSVARPGHSLHERGLAMDIDSIQADQLAELGLLEKYGFNRPVGGEPWHLQMPDFERRAGKIAAQTPGTQDPFADLVPSQGKSADPIADLIAAPQAKTDAQMEAGLKTIPEANQVSAMLMGDEAPQTAPTPQAGVTLPVTQGQPGTSSVAAQVQPTDATSETLAQYAGPAGEMVGEAINLPFKPLEYGIEKIGEQVRPWMVKAFPKATPQEIDMALHGLENVAVLGLMPSYARLLGRGAAILGQVGRENFYKYAPEWLLKSVSKGGLPVPLSPTEVADKLYAMSGPERAEMARKYPQFRDVLDEMTTMVSKEREAYSPEMAAKMQSKGEKLPYPPNFGETFEMRGQPGEVVSPYSPEIAAAARPQAALPPGQGFEMREMPPEVRRRPANPPVWETGQYPEVYETQRGKAVMSPETALKRAGYDDEQIATFMGTLGPKQLDILRVPPPPRTSAQEPASTEAKPEVMTEVAPAIPEPAKPFPEAGKVEGKEAEVRPKFIYHDGDIGAVEGWDGDTPIVRYTGDRNYQYKPKTGWREATQTDFDKLKAKRFDIDRRTTIGNYEQEFHKSGSGETRPYPMTSADRRREVLENRIKRGESVPDKLLQEFPDLAAKYAKPEKAPVGEGKGEEVPVKYSDVIKRAFADWSSGKAYIKNGQYRVKNAGSSSGPIAPWNKEVKAQFKDVTDFHDASQAYRKSLAQPKSTVPVSTETGGKEEAPQPAPEAKQVREVVPAEVIDTFIMGTRENRLKNIDERLVMMKEAGYPEHIIKDLERYRKEIESLPDNSALFKTIMKQTEPQPAPEAKAEGVKGEVPKTRAGLDESGAVDPMIVPKAVRAVIEDTVNIIREAPRQVKDAYEGIRDAGKRLWEWYKSPFETKEREYKKIVKEFLGHEQIAGYRNKEFINRITKAVPNKTTREGITNWMQAGGDEALLREWADKSKGPLKAGYEAGLKLTPEEKAIAAEITSKYSEYLKLAQEMGIVQDGLENYVNGLWKREQHNKTALAKLRSEINAGLLNTNFQYAKHKVFENYFAGEQAGYTPTNKDIAFLFGHYHQSMFKAINSRKMIYGLTKGVADDGRPLISVSGGGKQIPNEIEGKPFAEVPGKYDMTEAKGPEAYIIRPRAVYDTAADGRRYQVINHPALRKWKWIENDANGKPILIQGDLYVHPDAYRHLKNVLGTSAIRNYTVGRGALKVSQNLKGVLLSGLPSGFHQTHLATHAVFHKINPFTAPPIDFNDQIQRKAVESGLMVYNHNALSQFAEGLQSTGLAIKIPGIGRVTQAYGEYLFQDLIPRYKMSLFKEAYERNLKRYKGKYTEDQIAEITANQSNAAFGELNYRAMGRSPTLQDAFRLMSLAPDFLEARMRFAGQAIKPGGREQLAALFRGVLIMYVGGVVANMLFGDKHEPHWDKPFTLVYGGKAYSLRSVPGDLIHLFNDPRNFIYHRLNPSITKPLVEAVTKRDIWGRLRTWDEQLGDYFRGHVPIPVQGAVNKREQTLIQSVLQSIGVTSYKYKTKSDQIIGDFLGTKAMLNLPPEERAKMQTKRELVRLGQAGEEAKFQQKMAESGLTKKQKENVLSRIRDEKAYLFKTVNNIDKMVEAYEAGTPEEKQIFGPILREKINRLRDRNPAKYREYRELGRELRYSAPSKEYSILGR